MASPPPLPWQPAPACSFFPQDDELQTLAARMVRSQSTPIPMASPPPPPHPPQQPARAFSFYPQNYDLVMSYLLPKLAGSPLPASTEQFFHDADVYADDPEKLTSSYPAGPARVFGESENWYFFCPVKPTIARDGRKPRIVGRGMGTWKAEKGETVDDPAEGNSVGRLERFTYTPKVKKEGWRPEWLMVEFSLDQELVGGGEPSTVLCKIYRSPRFLGSATKSLSSSAASARKSKGKRKAADELPASSTRKNIKKAKGESTPARRQLLFPSAPAPNPLTPVQQAPVQQEPIQQEQIQQAPVQQAPVQQEPIQQAPVQQEPILEDIEAFLDDDQFWREYHSIGELSDPAPNPAVQQADDLGDQFWSGLPVLHDTRPPLGEPSVPWSCSMMTAASTPWCAGTGFWNSMATL